MTLLLHPFLLYIGYPILIIASLMAWMQGKWEARQWASY